MAAACHGCGPLGRLGVDDILQGEGMEAESLADPLDEGRVVQAEHIEVRAPPLLLNAI
jgi:hypothetical protein